MDEDSGGGGPADRAGDGEAARAPALADLVDVPAWQRLMEDCHALVQIPMAIIDVEGRVLVRVGWQDICTRFHRANEDTCRYCLESDTQLSAGLAQGEHRLYKCKNNLWDVATPIFVDGRHLGNVFSGQFFFDDEAVDREAFRAQARRYGFDEDQYLAALDRVPRLSRRTVGQGLAFFLRLADMLSHLGYANARLASLVTEREGMASALRESEHFYRLTLESIPGMVFTTRPDGFCDFQSQQWVDFTGVPMEEHLGDGWNALLHPEDRPRAYAAWQAAVEDRAPYDLKYRVRRRDGQYEWFKVRGVPLRDAGGRIARWFGVAANIDGIKRTEEALRRSEEALRQSLREKEVLLKEVHHRVKNNLQVVASLLNLQAARGDVLDREREALVESQNRVRTLALIHEQLYGSNDFSRIPFRSYLTKLVRGVLESFGEAAAGVALTLDLEDLALPLDTAVPLALMVNELTANALKHAFPDRRPGRLVLNLRRTGDERCRLTVADDGCGFPAGLDFRATQSLGLQLVVVLASQIDAGLELGRREGTEFVIDFRA